MVICEECICSEECRVERAWLFNREWHNQQAHSVPRFKDGVFHVQCPQGHVHHASPSEIMRLSGVPALI